MEARFYFHPENPQVRLSPHVRPIWARESDPFPPALSRGVQRDSLGPRIRNCRNTSASGWELESQISPCVDIVTDILLITVVYWKHSSSVRGMSASDYALQERLSCNGNTHVGSQGSTETLGISLELLPSVSLEPASGPWGPRFVMCPLISISSFIESFSGGR